MIDSRIIEEIGKGVEIILRDKKGREIKVLENGYLGVLTPGTIAVTLTINQAACSFGKFYGLERVGQLDVTLKRDHSEEDNIKIYIRNIPVFDGGTKGPYTKYPDNHFKLLEILVTGHFRIWEIAITKRGGVFYLSTQPVWDEYAFRKGNKVVVPAMPAWESLRKILQGLIKPSYLASTKSYEPKPAITTEGLVTKQGRVIWWNEANGIGALATATGIARFHRRNLVVQHEWVTFEKGEIVKYKNLTIPHLNEGEKTTSFKLEAIGVEKVFRIEKLSAVG
jgi:hypothetical protein